MPHTTLAYIARHPADRHHHHESQTNAQTHAPLPPLAGYGGD
jgi:hypothetical protein